MLRLEWLAQDLRKAIRVLQKNKLWTSVAVITLGLGIAPGTCPEHPATRRGDFPRSEFRS